MSDTVAIGIIGGSGLYQMPELTEVQEVRPSTPFGAPSDALMVGRIAGTPVAFLARHGRGHRFNPTEVPYRANIYALKSLGVQQIISLSAVGSLKAEHRPLDFVLPDQFIDRTRLRQATFFGDGLVAHVGFADPICRRLLQHLEAACRSQGVTVHAGGVYLNMEGPAFSTRAESNLYRSWGCDVIGMTNLTEAKLAREAEICYVTVATVTDYDCWHTDHGVVTVEEIVANLTRNADNARAVVRAAVPLLAGGPGRCHCQSALAHAFLTDPRAVPPQTLERLHLLVGKYFPGVPA